MSPNEEERLRQQAAHDQNLALMAETLPAIWRRLYLNCLKEGFTETEAMELVKTFILSIGGAKA